MGCKVKFYTIAFEDCHNRVVNRDVINFLNRIENEILLVSKSNAVRSVGEKKIRIFKYYRDSINPNERFVIPFAQLKQRGSVYADDGGVSLKDIDFQLYDISSMCISKQENVIFINADRGCPRYQEIEDYLNTYINDDYRLRIRPIYYNSGLENVRNAVQIRSVVLSLDLGASVNDFISPQTNNNIGTLSALRELMSSTSSTLENKTIQLSLGLDRIRNRSINKHELLSLLNEINIDSNCVKEITVIFKNSPEEKLQPARIKDGIFELYYEYTVRQPNLSPEYLNINATEAFDSKRGKFSAAAREYLSDYGYANDDYVLLSENS